MTVQPMATYEQVYGPGVTVDDNGQITFEPGGGPEPEHDDDDRHGEHPVMLVGDEAGRASRLSW